MSEADLWHALRRYTSARLGLGRAGAALPTQALLAFELAHAQARDAVHAEVDWGGLEQTLREAGESPVTVSSQAHERALYLRRPDLGRRLDEPSRARVVEARETPAPDLVWILADGLSATALNHHGVNLYRAARAVLPTLRFAPPVLARNARVALGDEIGALFGARFVVIAIGERPGLSSPDSLGLYLTAAPRVGRSDAERNCLSNIHGAGMPYAVAARKLAALIREATRLGLTGTAVKDLTDASGAALAAPDGGERG